MASEGPAPETTVLLREWQRGDRSNQNALFERLYADLHRLARHLSIGGGPMSPTSLVVEAYLRLDHAQALNVNNREHFLALAARTMRRIIIDHARWLHAGKRSADFSEEKPLEEIPSLQRSPEDLICLDDALEHLGRINPRFVLVVELLVFGSLPVQEVAAVLAVDRKTVRRDIRRIGKELPQLGYAAAI